MPKPIPKQNCACGWGHTKPCKFGVDTFFFANAGNSTFLAPGIKTCLANAKFGKKKIKPNVNGTK